MTIFSKTSLLVLALVLSTPVSAQSVTGAPLRVQVQISVQRNTASSDNPDEQDKSMDAARRMIYESVKSECAILASVFDADCRLTNVNAGSSIMDRGNMGPMVNANGNASYELTPRRAGTHDGK
jgi:hypothetical protein